MKIFTQWSKYAKYKLEFAKLLLMGRIMEDNVKLKFLELFLKVFLKCCGGIPTIKYMNLEIDRYIYSFRFSYT